MVPKECSLSAQEVYLFSFSSAHNHEYPKVFFSLECISTGCQFLLIVTLLGDFFKAHLQCLH